MYDVTFFKVDRFDYEIGSEKWIAGIKSSFVPRIGDNVAVLFEDDALEVIDVKIYYEAKEEKQCYNPFVEVYLMSKDIE